MCPYFIWLPLMPIEEKSTVMIIGGCLVLVRKRVKSKVIDFSIQ